MLFKANSSGRLAPPEANTPRAGGTPERAAKRLQSDERGQVPLSDAEYEAYPADVDPLFQFLPENQIVLERSNGNAQALDEKLAQLSRPSPLRKIDVACREAEQYGDRAAAIGESEKRLGRLDVVQDLAKTIDDRLAALERRAAATAAQLERAVK